MPSMFTSNGDLVEVDSKKHHERRIAHHENIAKEIRNSPFSYYVVGIGLPLAYHDAWIGYHKAMIMYHDSRSE